VPNVLTFDEFVDLIRVRLGAADALKPSYAHNFRDLFKPEEVTAIPDNWWDDAFEELEAQEHLDPRASGKAMGIGNVHARLSADGRLYLRQQEDS
jgi:hypothetical protein